MFPKQIEIRNLDSCVKKRFYLLFRVLQYALLPSREQHTYDVFKILIYLKMPSKICQIGASTNLNGFSRNF